MKRWVAIGIGVLLMLWVPFLYWQLQTSAAPPPPPSPEPEPSDPAVEAPAEPAPRPSAPSAQAEPARPEPAPAPTAVPPTAPQAEPAPEAEIGPDGLPKDIPVPAGGPVAQLKAAYEGSSRDAEASAIEAEIRAQFGKDDVPVEMLRSVTCHEDACRVEVLWSRERVLPFMRLAMTWGQRFGMEIGSEAGETDSAGFTPLTVYIARGKGPDRPEDEAE